MDWPKEVVTMSEVAGETSAVAVCIAHVALKFEGGGERSSDSESRLQIP